MGALSEAPPPPPVSLAEVKAQLRITTSEEDALIAGYVRAAAETCERFTGRALVARTAREVLAARGGWQRLALAPVRSIDAVAALDETGAATPLGADAYRIDIDASGDGWVRVTGAGEAKRVRVDYSAGLAGDAGGVPEALRQGIVRLAAYLHGRRDEASPPPASVTALWRPWRRMRLG